MQQKIQFIETSPEELVAALSLQLIPSLTKEISKQFQKSPEELLTVNEVAKLLKVNRSTIDRWKNDGTLPYYGMGNRIYFKRSEIEQIIEQNKIG